MDPIEKILCQQPSGVLSLVGGGGKTSIMFHLARQLAAAGKKVLTTTTTKIFVPTIEQSATLLVNPDPEVILTLAVQQLMTTRHLTAAAKHVPDGDKLKGFSPECIQLFEQSCLFDWILVEADGSARKPLKAPAEHEPVIPANTTILVAVAGLEVIGQPLSDDLVFRSTLAAERMQLREGEVINETALVHLLSHSQGSFKAAPALAHKLIFLNKADTLSQRASAAKIALQLKKQDIPVADALIVGQALEEIKIHNYFQLGDKT